MQIPSIVRIDVPVGTASSPPLGPVAEDERLAALDVLRALALLGVLLVNLLTEFRVSVFEQFFGPTSGSQLDRAIDRFVKVAIEFKAFILFSFLFGVGLAIQFDRARRSRRAFGAHVVRRLAALLGIGLAHLVLVWNGDILTEYAIAGFLALPLLWSERAVLPTALLLFAVRLAPLPFPEPFRSREAMRAHIELANALYAHGSFGTVEAFRIRELPAILALLLNVLPRTLGLFALGIGAYRAGAFAREGGRSPLVRTTAVVGLFAGGMGTLVTTGVLGDVSLGAWDSFAFDVAAIALALGYGALLLVAYERRPARRVLDLFAPLGRMALTNYLMQSLVFGLVFYGYGLGRFGAMSVTHALLLGLGVYAAQVAASAWWLHRFRFGPVEWLWRSATYAAWQPFRYR